MATDGGKMEMDAPLSFVNAEEEVQFWKEKALSFKKNFNELKEDFDEYQDDSKTLEQELDTQLKQEERKIKDLTASVQRLQSDNENLRSRLEHMTAENNARTTEWNTKMAAVRKTEEDTNQYIRQLEQQNDDLERTNRAAAMTIEELGLKLNQAIERYVDAESELDEVEDLREMVQRLKEETRDLRYELLISKKHKASTECLDSIHLDELVPSSTPPPTTSPIVGPGSKVRGFRQKIKALLTISKPKEYNSVRQTGCFGTKRKKGLPFESP